MTQLTTPGNEGEKLIREYTDEEMIELARTRGREDLVELFSKPRKKQDAGWKPSYAPRVRRASRPKRQRRGS